MRQLRVGGEPASDLKCALRYFKTGRRGAYLSMSSARSRPPYALPIFRALMRIEAELLLEEADGLTAPSDIKTPGERSAAALVELLRRLMDLG